MPGPSAVWFSFMLLAQPAVEAPPLAGRPPQFSHVVGTYRIETSATPTQVIVEQPLLLKVRILGQGPKEYQPYRKHLRIFPDDFAQQFFVEDVPEQDRIIPEENAWEFVYRLRPKSTDVKFIPGLKLVYYHPGRQKYATSFADAIPLTVTPPEKVDPPPPKTIVAPPGFLELSSPEGGGFWRLPHVPPWWVLVPGLALPPLFCFVVGWWWPRRHSRNHAIQTNESVRKAFACLTNGAATEENVALALNRYLREKLHLTTVEPTPLEVANRLGRLGASKDLTREVQGLLEASDRVRFMAQSDLKVDDLCNSAIRIMHRLETEPCVQFQS